MAEHELDTIPTKRDWLLPLVLLFLSALVSLGVSASTGYLSNDKNLTGRVIAIETQQKNDNERLGRIETKLDKVLDELRK